MYFQYYSKPRTFSTWWLTNSIISVKVNGITERGNILMTNNEYPIIFCNPYSIAKTILSSTRNEQLKRLSVWTDHKRYIKKKENEALSDL